MYLTRDTLVVHKYQWTVRSIGELLDKYGSKFIAKNVGKEKLYDFEQIEYKTTNVSLKNHLEILCEDVPMYVVNAATVIQKYTRRFLVKRGIHTAKTLIEEGVDFHTDFITTESICMPVIILSDWECGTKIIYNHSTIAKCALTEDIPVFYYLDQNNEQQECTKSEYIYSESGLILYSSPFTRKQFTLDNLSYIQDTKWYIFGKLLQSNVLDL
jgi:hypothetical protein